jgi:hypothetical protein
MRLSTRKTGRGQRREHKSAEEEGAPSLSGPPISFGSWLRRLIHGAVGLLLFVSVLDVRRCGAAEGIAGTGNSLIKIGTAVIVGCIALASALRIRPRSFRIGKLVWLYGGIALASLLWSFDARQSAIGAGGLVVYTGIAGVASAMPSRDVLRTVARTCDFVVLASLILYALSPRLAVDYVTGTDRLAGLTYGSHALARCAAVALLVRLSERRDGSVRRRIAMVFWGLLYVAVFVLADSRQVYAAGLVAVCALYWPRSHIRALACSVVACTGICLAGLLLHAAGYDAAEALQNSLARSATEDVASLSGRTDIWQAAVRLAAKRPWVGYGFNAGGLALSSSYSTGVSEWTTHSAHNVVLHCMLDLGALGTIVLVLIMLSGIIRTFGPGRRLELAIVAMVVCLGAAERSIAGAPGFLFLIFMLAYVRRPVATKRLVGYTECRHAVA